MPRKIVVAEEKSWEEVLATLLAPVVAAIVCSLFLLPVVPILLGAYILLVGWTSQSKLLKVVWVVSCFLVPYLYSSDFFVFESMRKTTFPSWVVPALSVYYVLGIGGIIAIVYEMVVGGCEYQATTTQDQQSKGPFDNVKR